MRNAPVGGGGNDGRRAGAEVTVVDLFADALGGGLHIGGAVSGAVNGGSQELVAFGQRAAGDLLVARPKHHAIDAALRGAARLAKAGRHARQVQQFDHDVFKNVTGPGAFFQAFDKAAALADAAVVFEQRGQQRQQPLVKAGQLVAGRVFQRSQIKPDFQHCPVRPDVRAVQIVDAQKLDVVLLAHGWQIGRKKRSTGQAGVTFYIRRGGASDGSGENGRR